MTSHTRPLVIFGAGRIARALITMLAAQEDDLAGRLGRAFPISALSTSRLIATGSPVLSAADLELLAHSLPPDVARVEPLGAERLAVQQDAITRAAEDLDASPIVVDLTASDATTPALLWAITQGADVVLANKKPLCASQETFDRLAMGGPGHLGYEATVGAGLPIIETLRGLLAAGDGLVEATACLSGTLGYICAALDDGMPLSRIVPEALERGYTEPDPRDDLGGADVRRKALILSRTLGRRIEISAIPVTPLLPLEDGPVDDWLRGLTQHDARMAERWRAAAMDGMTMRYVAHLTAEGGDVGLREVPRDSAIGRLKGTDNVVNLYTRFYADRPLYIQGPGAGPTVTAAAVLGDIIRLAC